MERNGRGANIVLIFGQDKVRKILASEKRESEQRDPKIIFNFTQLSV
jgi:hypothetical protein